MNTRLTTTAAAAAALAMGTLGLGTAVTAQDMHAGMHGDPKLEKMDDADGNGRKLGTTLSGAAEVPGPGDPDGTGEFVARINPGQGQLCYELDVDDVDDITGAHIHLGGRDEAGPVVVALETPDDDDSQGCLAVDREVAMAMIRNPEGYYVNVHNTEYPAGAVRGQLTK